MTRHNIPHDFIIQPNTPAILIDWLYASYFYFQKLIILTFPSFYFKKAAEGSFDQPTCKLWACRATTAPPRYSYFFSFFLYSILPFFYFLFCKKLHHRESNPGHKRERLVCYQLHHNGYLYYMFLLSFLFIFLFSIIFSFSYLYFWEVSWCSWLSHHFHVVRVPGSNPGGTIFDSFYHAHECRPFYLPTIPSFYHTYLLFFLL